MESKSFRLLNDKDITDAVKGIIEESSYLKTKIFKSLLTNEKIDYTIPRSYKNSVNDFIDIWTEYANNLVNRINNSEGTTGVQTISYTLAKDYIYANDDYASVLPFADGVIEGIKTRRFDESDDVKDFFIYTVNKAFNNKGESVASLLDKVINNSELDTVTADIAEVTKFNSIRNYEIFNTTDNRELRKSIEMVVDFICDDISESVNIREYNMKMGVAMVNNIIEYITYSLTAYATRIYLISKYASPYISPSDTTPSPMTESSITDLNDSELVVHVMRDTSELDCRNYIKDRDFIESLSTFCKAIGADPLFGTNKAKPGRWYSFTQLLKDDNKLRDNLVGNSLYEYIVDSSVNDVYGSKEFVTEMNHILKECVFNINQAIEGSSTPKQEILYIIRNSKYDDSVKGYQQLTKDLYVLAGSILTGIVYLITGIEDWLSNKFSNSYYNTTNVNDAKENIKILKDLYSELAVAFLYKFRDIEMNFNVKKYNQLSKLYGDLSLTNNMMSAVPHTTRIPMDLMEFYDGPTFEALQLYDDYLRTLPGMEDDPYLSEATNESGLINSIKSKILSIYNKFSNFITDKRFQSYREWAINHTDNINNLDFTGKSMWMIPYKENITLPKGFENLYNNLNNKFNKDILTSEESVKAFIKTLYPDPKIYDWFYSNTITNTDATLMYRNYVLFYNSVEETKKETPVAKQYVGVLLKDKIKDFIDTIRNGNDTLTSFKGMSENINNAVNRVKQQIVAFENEEKQQELADKKAEEAARREEAKKAAEQKSKQTTEDNKSGQNKDNNTVQPTEAPAVKDTTNKTNNADNKNDNHVSNTKDLFLTELNLAIMRIYGALTSYLIQTYIQQSKYVKEAYSIGRTKNN